MTSIWAWSTTAASNSNSDSGIAWPEGQAANTVNDSARVMMQRLAQFLNDLAAENIATGTANAILLTTTSTISALADGIMVGFTAALTNSGATTLTVNSTASTNVYANNAALTGGEIVAGSSYIAIYHTAHAGSGRLAGWHLVNPKITAVTLSGVSSISVSSASDAFKITQIGAGNAFVVEDAASTDSTPFIIDTNGNVIVGHTAALATYLDDSTAAGAARTAKKQHHGVDDPLSMSAVSRWDNTANGPNLILTKSRSGTVGTYTVVQTGDTLGVISFQGADGTDFARGAVIKAIVNGTPGGNDLPTDLQFLTTPDGSATPTLALTLTSAQAATFTGKVTTPASTTGRAGLNLGALGTAPSSPALNDVWTISGKLVYYDGTAARTIASANTWTLADLTLATGNTLYATGAGALTNLAIGTAGQVLTVNAGATAPQWSSPAWVMVVTDTAFVVGGSSIDLTIDTDTYDVFELVIDSLKFASTTAGNIDLSARHNASGTALATWRTTATAWNGAAPAASDRYFGRLVFTAAQNTAASAVYNCWGRLEYAGLDASGPNFNTGATLALATVTGHTSKADRIRITVAGDTFDGGSYRLYARRKSF